MKVSGQLHAPAALPQEKELPVPIRIGYLPNTSLEGYHYATLFCSELSKELRGNLIMDCRKIDCKPK
jgi:hypothetical protein